MYCVEYSDLVKNIFDFQTYIQYEETDKFQNQIQLHSKILLHDGQKSNLAKGCVVYQVKPTAFNIFL